MALLKNVNLLGLIVLVVVVLAGVLGLTKSLRHEGFVGDYVVKACDRESDCPSGYRCDSQTCVKTHEFWNTTKTTEGFDQISELKLNGMKCNSGDECRSGTCLRSVCMERNELWKE